MRALVVRRLYMLGLHERQMSHGKVLAGRILIWCLAINPKIICLSSDPGFRLVFSFHIWHLPTKILLKYVTFANSSQFLDTNIFQTYSEICSKRMWKGKHLLIFGTRSQMSGHLFWQTKCECNKTLGYMTPTKSSGGSSPIYNATQKLAKKLAKCFPRRYSKIWNQRVKVYRDEGIQNF